MCGGSEFNHCDNSEWPTAHGTSGRQIAEPQANLQTSGRSDKPNVLFTPSRLHSFELAMLARTQERHHRPLPTLNAVAIHSFIINDEKSVSADVQNSRKRKFLRIRQDFTAHSVGRSAYSANVDTEARETQISVVGDSASPYGGKPP